MSLIPVCPSQSAVIPIGNGKAFFLSEWPREPFKSLRAFGVFCFQYASAMQPLIHGWPDDKVQAWLVVDPDAEARYLKWSSTETVQHGDPVSTLTGLLGDYLPKWAAGGKWSEFIVAESDSDFELIGEGAQSFLSVFLADELPDDD